MRTGTKEDATGQETERTAGSQQKRNSSHMANDLSKISKTTKRGESFSLQFINSSLTSSYLSKCNIQSDLQQRMTKILVYRSLICITCSISILLRKKSRFSFSKNLYLAFNFCTHFKKFAEKLIESN